MRERAMAKKRPRRTLEDLYGGGENGNLLRGQYASRQDIHELIQKRHERGAKFIDADGYWVSPNGNHAHRWKVPYGVRDALHQRLLWAQVVNKYPYFVTWVSPRTHRRLRKKFMSLPGAIDFIATRAQYVDPNASIISRHGFHIPIPLMGKFPRRLTGGRVLYWCPMCMDQRRFRRTSDIFYGSRKFSVYNRHGEFTGYEWRSVKLSLMTCRVCGCTNRDDKFRRSNQPLEKRKLKQGVRRARRK